MPGPIPLPTSPLKGEEYWYRLTPERGRLWFLILQGQSAGLDGGASLWVGGYVYIIISVDLTPGAS